MKKFVKPYALLCYILSIIGGFFLGLAIAAFTDAAEGQMLAGGAIVFFYGVIGGTLGLVLALMLAFKANRKVIITMNLFYVIATILCFLYLRGKKQQRDLERQQRQEQIDQQNQPTGHLGILGART